VNLARLNEEYAAKTTSGRLLPVEIRELPVGTWAKLKHSKTNGRGNFDQYKHPCLANDLEFAGRLAGRRMQSAVQSVPAPLGLPATFVTSPPSHSGRGV
jgi:hypothetical protein